jgi:hypothetical protein
MLIPFILCFFLLRDFLLLKMGPPSKVLARLRVYAGVLLGSELLFSVATSPLTTERLLQLARSPRVILPLALFYAALAILCLWVRRTDRHNIAWFIAILPNPLLVIGIAIVARWLAPAVSPATNIVGPSLLACLWIAAVSLFVRAARHAPQDVPELDFSLGLAGLVNSIALLALPIESFLANANGWSEFLRQLGAMLSAD